MTIAMTYRNQNGSRGDDPDSDHKIIIVIHSSNIQPHVDTWWLLWLHCTSWCSNKIFWVRSIACNNDPGTSMIYGFHSNLRSTFPTSITSYNTNMAEVVLPDNQK
jgi:hypothetical protein